MSNFNIIFGAVDFFYQRKIINFFKKNIDYKLNTLVDVGAHNGETINLFLKNFDIKNIYSFEASESNFIKLETNTKKIKKKYPSCNIKIINIGVGNSNENKLFYDLSDTNSSTFNTINEQSSYFKRKKKILSLLIKKDFFVKKN